MKDGVEVSLCTRNAAERPCRRRSGHRLAGIDVVTGTIFVVGVDSIHARPSRLTTTVKRGFHPTQQTQRTQLTQLLKATIESVTIFALRQLCALRLLRLMKPELDVRWLALCVIPIQPNAHNVRNLRMKVRNKRNE